MPQLSVREHWPYKAANIIAWLVFGGATSYSHLAPDSTLRSADTYLTPASWFIYSVQSLIHIGLVGMLAYQFTKSGTELVYNALGVRFPLLCLVNAVFHAAISNPQHHDRFGWDLVAFVAVLISAGFVSHIYRELKLREQPKELGDILFVHLPFSLWHGFTVVVLFLSAFVAFGVDAEKHHAGVFTKILVFLALLFLEATAAGYVMAGHGDILGALVISLSILAIFQHQTVQHSGKFIHYSALAFFIISILPVGQAFIASLHASRTTVQGTEEERAPLVA